MQKRIVGLCVLLAICSTVKSADPVSNVDQMAQDGYWVKTSATYGEAMKLLGKPAPEIRLSGWQGKEPERKGKIVLIDFWATWCGPCLAQIPHANEMAKKYADKGVVVFGACCPEGAETMGKVAKEKGMEYATGKLTKQTVEKWKIGFWPTYAIIDASGNLRAIGLVPDRVEPVLDALLAEQGR